MKERQLGGEERLKQTRVVVLAPSDTVLDVPLVLDRLLALLGTDGKRLGRGETDLESVVLVTSPVGSLLLPLLGSDLLGRTLDGVGVARVLRNDGSDVDGDVQGSVGRSKSAGNECSLNPGREDAGEVEASAKKKGRFVLSQL